MGTNTTVNRADLFVRYEAELAGLSSIPGQLKKDLAKAQADYDTAITTATTSALDKEQRLTRLHQNVATRFSASAQSLRDASILVPHQVRAAAGRKGDPDSLTSAVTAQYEAEKAVKFELQSIANAAKLQAASAKSGVASSREAAEALRRRQEKIRKAREEAECKQAEDRRLAKKHRQLMIAGGVGLMILIILLSAQFL